MLKTIFGARERNKPEIEQNCMGTKDFQNSSPCTVVTVPKPKT
jgi:hypothetical protein